MEKERRVGKEKQKQEEEKKWRDGGEKRRREEKERIEGDKRVQKRSKGDGHTPQKRNERRKNVLKLGKGKK